VQCALPAGPDGERTEQDTKLASGEAAGSLRQPHGNGAAHGEDQQLVDGRKPDVGNDFSYDNFAAAKRGYQECSMVPTLFTGNLQER